MSAVRKQGQRLWTAEQRLEQSRRLRDRQIWRKSTGPRTWDGKRVSSQNALKHGRFSAESKSIRSWLCFVSRNLKYIKATLRHHDRATKLAKKYFSQNELRDIECDKINKLHVSQTTRSQNHDNTIPFPVPPPSPPPLGKK